MAAKGNNYPIFRPEVWSDYMRVFFKKRLVASDHFQDFSSDVASGGKTIVIPHIAKGPAAGSLTTTTGDITENVITDTGTRLDINKWVYNAYRFTDYQTAQIAAQYNLQAEYGKSIAYGLKETFDTCLLQTAQNNLQRRVSNSSTSIAATDLRSAMKIIDSYSIPREDCILVIAPDHYWELMRSETIYNASIFGISGGTAPMPAGTHDRIFGIPVVRTANVPTYGVGSKADLLVHKRAVAYAIGNITGMSAGGPRIQMKASSEGLYNKLIGDLMFGVKILDDYAGVKIIGRVGA
jgi:hypothetical protein